MTGVFAAAGPSAYWYLSRGTGVVALLLLTAAVLLGILDEERFAAPRWPRFVVDRLHRDVSLLVLVVLVVHIITSVLDKFAPIQLLDAVIPFVSAYRPLWLGLGALAFDLLLAVAITSLIRRRLGYQAWRAVHWLAYASWPVAVFHGVGTGSDVKQGWLLAVTALCVLTVIVAVLVRLGRAGAARGALRPALFVLTLGTPVALAAFTIIGPFAPHWARRAGTPTALLRKTPAVRIAAVRRAPAAAPRRQTRDSIPVPFNAQLAGRVSQIEEPGGALVDLVLHCSGDIHGVMRVRIAGAPVPGGGLSMTGSQVQLSAVGLTSALQGRITELQGQQFVARVRNAAGTALELHANLNIDSTSNAVTGTLSAAGA